MGLLDSVLGAVLNGGQQQQAPAAGGGLGGLVGKFQQAGMGDAIGSWIGTGENQAVTGDQLGNVLGEDALSGLAQKMGLNVGDAGGILAQVLPELVNHMTPTGQAPTTGLGNAGDLMGMLGGLLNRKA